MHTCSRSEERLELLNQAQPDRPWSSVAERRRCVACESTFRGDEVIICKSRQGRPQLACPNCGSKSALWVRLGNPLTDATVWADWEAAMLRADGEDGDLALAG